jgi:hypothetical protein
MAATWYYVEDNERVGPVGEEDFVTLIKKRKIVLESYVWKKGFDNWTLLKEVEDYRDLANLQMEALGDVESFNSPEPVSRLTQNNDVKIDREEVNASEVSSTNQNDISEVNHGSPSIISFDWDEVDRKERIFTIRIGRDRGIKPVEYGPFSFDMIQDLLEQKRANFLTEIFAPGLDAYQEIGNISAFNAKAEELESKNKRKHSRAPLVARLFFHDNENFFEGVCRDISIGGMQILVANFDGEVGDLVKLNVHPVEDSLQFTAEAKIVRTLTECSGVSVRFLKMTPDNLEKINKYIELYEDE